ncbi:MAG TPA: DsbA family oxidoreductase [Rubrivivax sp.]|jgi:predicted DsbA family dithiol-disulfide isomerase|nr:DsbA family oxidoreductase [Rubrivivax sp.]
MKIDFISDVACPWCAVGLNSLERALERIGDEIPVKLEFQPFELNPTMDEEGADAAEYLRNKYGMSAEQLQRNRENIRARGAEVGFAFGERMRVWNTFDAHRLLHWAGLQGADRQRALKHALLKAYHGEGRNPGAADVLVELASACGLDAQAARQVLDSGSYADEVRAAERQWQQAGINSVPAVVIDGKHLIQGGQPVEVFERALRQIAAQDGG